MCCDIYPEVDILVILFVQLPVWKVVHIVKQPQQQSPSPPMYPSICPSFRCHYASDALRDMAGRLLYRGPAAVIAPGASPATAGAASETADQPVGSVPAAATTTTTPTSTVSPADIPQGPPLAVAAEASVPAPSNPTPLGRRRPGEDDAPGPISLSPPAADLVQDKDELKGGISRQEAAPGGELSLTREAAAATTSALPGRRARKGMRTRLLLRQGMPELARPTLQQLITGERAGIGLLLTWVCVMDECRARSLFQYNPLAP